jgi:uncharacterized membrane protein YadS
MFSPYDHTHLAATSASEKERARKDEADGSLPVFLLSTMLVCLIASLSLVQNNASVIEGAQETSTIYAIIGIAAAGIGMALGLRSQRARLTKRILLITSLPFLLGFSAILWRLLS